MAANTELSKIAPSQWRDRLIERLLSKVSIDTRTRCWNWTAGKFSGGYGVIWANGAPKGTHRLSYELYCGQIPDGMHVLHRCDNRTCINPAHLFLGTNTENMADKTAKGRQARGETQFAAKLTEADVIAIRSADKEHGLLTKLAGLYGVSKQLIHQVRAGKGWEHIK